MNWKCVLAFIIFSTGGFGLQAAAPLPVYKDPGQPIEKRVADTVVRMTLEEKVRFVTGVKKPKEGLAGGIGVPRLGIPNLIIVHGPYGYKGWFGKEGGPMQIGTYFPVSIAMASTWDFSMVERIATAMGAEMYASGGHINDGPAMNIIRDPRCGRSFEYFTEDPFLNGEIATAYTIGIQSQKVMSGLKHFVCNNQEFNRGRVNVVVSQRALREIYFPGFEAAIVKGGALNVMGAYNKLNGVYCCEDPFLLQQVLRKEWGFRGFVQSDSGATHSTKGSAEAGTDIEMSREVWYGKKLLQAVKDGTVREDTLNTMVGNILYGMFWAGAFDAEPSLDKSVLCKPEHIKIAREAAAQSMVLLKNDNGVLPFDLSKIKKIAVIGPNGSYGPHYNNGKYDYRLLQGGGSASVKLDRDKLITPFQGLKWNAGNAVNVVYAPGCYAEDGCGTIPSKYLRTPDGQQEGLLANYYNNARFAGDAVKTEVDSSISHLWKAEKPFPEAGLSNDDGSRFSVVWSGTIHPPETRSYTFAVRNYSGMARLYINGKLLASNERGDRRDWNDMHPIKLEGGKTYDIRLEYAKIGGLADVRLEWDYENVQWMKQAVQLARESDAVVLTVGLSGESGETEGGDRKHLRLFPAQEQLIRKVAQANKNTAVAVIAGSAIDMRNWMDAVPSILMAWYPGQEGGNGLADVLFGKVDPGGRLPITFPTSLAQYPDDFYSTGDDVVYKEGIFVGYRYFDENKLDPLFPFGYGLSYTTFAYGEPKVQLNGQKATVTLDVTNTGTRSGSEVVQLYVHDIESSVPRPPKELKAFKKIFLKPGETQPVTMELNHRSFAFFDETCNDWKIEPGAFELLIGSSSRDIRQKAVCRLK